MTNATQDTVNQATTTAGLDVDAVAAQVDAVLQEDLYWFPVRHHSPSVAMQVQRAIRLRKPRLIFIEAPADANALVPHIVNKDTRPPVAIYSSYRDDNNTLKLAGIASASEDIPARFAAWYPLMAYSPEYVAMCEAARIGAKVVFMDLPHYALIKPYKEPEEEAPAAAPPDQTISDADAEQLMAESSFYQALARVAGFRTWNEAWDTLFEFGGYASQPDADGLERYRRELATFCAAARATAPAGRIAEDGTLERESHMIRTIRKGLATHNLQPADAMVICGGFHLFLDREPAIEPPAAPEGTVYVSLIPYSFFRISEMSGYAAGNRAPQFYQACWEHMHRGKLEDLLPTHTVAVLKRARREGEALSPADAIAVSQHAHLLASLRQRPTPILEDLHDALITCCCKGDPEVEGRVLRKAMDYADIGRAIGKVTDQIGRLPLVNDFFLNLEALQLNELVEEEKVLKAKLDKREELDQNRSAFLHRLRFLGIPVGTLISSERSDLFEVTLFKEIWNLKWNPQIEPKLIEENLYGDTIESAAFSRLREALAKDGQHAGKCCEHLLRALDMDLPDMIQQVQDQCVESVANDQQFVSLASALANLQLVKKR